MKAQRRVPDRLAFVTLNVQPASEIRGTAEEGEDHETRQEDNSLTANTCGVADNTLCCYFADGCGPTAAGRRNDTTAVGHGIY